MIKREEIEGLLKDMLDCITDADLRAKVLDAWMLGIAEGGWQSVEELRAMPFTLVTDTRGINFLEHTLVVTRSAVAMAEAQKAGYAKMPYAVDMDRLIAGGLLHDVGKLLEITRKSDGTHVRSRNGSLQRHPVSGAILCAKAGLSEEIINIVACHASEGEGRPQVVETVLIHQADFATFDPLVLMKEGKLIQ